MPAHAQAEQSMHSNLIAGVDAYEGGQDATALPMTLAAKDTRRALVFVATTLTPSTRARG